MMMTIMVMFAMIMVSVLALKPAARLGQGFFKGCLSILQRTDSVAQQVGHFWRIRSKFIRPLGELSSMALVMFYPVRQHYT